mmetsp:Transcript_2525/g.3827  ORF Transcript_2525/g.3827 Transcript_2525/m.3827 type:complete len:306 (+) Transcript_2525:149-1066(+)|eukprot:CAMPEP_0195526468 /NCGR_PEP_ID=MMETSP0794_2-20130614/27543_1 /TAXON_ID=515487 /ORGANISM="Stephanopyxis turris, Strain CCMP 815" /LENGTH=305 /DNA_ID=CAMNT_0040657157 /DNA_START=107 /DNA_END=1024 /DNA_ORIENTATION=+
MSLFNRKHRKAADTSDLVETSPLAVTTGEASLSLGDVELNTVGKRKAAINSAVTADMTEMTEEEIEKGKPIGLVSFIIYCICSFTVVVSIAVMAFEHDLVSYVALSFPVALSPVVAYQRYQIVEGDSFRTAVNSVRMEVNRLMGRNSNLTASNNKVKADAAKLKKCEEDLNNVLQGQGKTTSEFINLTKKNQALLDTIKANIHGNVVQELLKAVMQSDRNSNFILESEEIDLLVLRMSNNDIVKFNEDHFRAQMRKNGHGLAAVLDICKTLIDGEHEDEADEEHVFHVDMKVLSRNFRSLSAEGN